MRVIPVVNCMDFESAEERVRLAEKFDPSGDGWVHLDVADARFTYNKTWGDPSGWRMLQTSLKLEVHLMVENPELVVREWLSAGAKRIIVHLEAVKDEDLVLAMANEFGAEVMLAIVPESPAESLSLYFKKFSAFQILSVSPGLAGQEFLRSGLDKVRFLRGAMPNAKIEVDGGMNFETAQQVLDAGADIIVAGSFIFNSPNPYETYRTLAALEPEI